MTARRPPPADADAAAARAADLRRLLEQANHDYWVLAAPTMSDSEYDALLAELVALEDARPALRDPDSPTQRVGGEPLEGFETVAHAVPMQSIDNTYGVDDLRAWHDRVRKGLGLDEEADDGEAPAFVCDPKIDGVAVSLRYEDGRLARAVTRGDGIRGDDVTAQVRTVRSIPLRLRDAAPAVLEVRGELFIPNREFERINAERKAAGEPLFANARNATAGTLKSLDPRVAAARRLGFVAHGRGAVEGMEEVATFWEFCAALRAMGVPVSRWAERCETIDAVIEVIEAFAGRRAGLGYGVDGMVVRVDRFDQQARLGATSKAPRWCIAF
ncbi:MAG: NAD-dependent DNA ligase, partial [Planctomycetota bacterium]